MLDINIASATKPLNVQGFFTSVQDFARNNGPCRVTAGVVTAGPGCNNYGFRIEGPEKEAEKLANCLCMALMPAKWCEVQDDPALRPGQFYSDL